MSTSKTSNKDYKVGDKVVVEDASGKRFDAVIVNINDFREPSLKYCLDIKGFDDFVFVGYDYIKELVK